jgi:3-methyladenine DNA glycosylase/8-oxoguanine DNA glycosylase
VLGPLRHGGGDPSTTFVGGTCWRACLTPEGPGRIALWRDGDTIRTRSWGPGADWLLASVEGLIGFHDDWSELDLTGQPLLARVLHRLPGLRLGRSALVLDSLVPAVLEQRVTGIEAWRAWRGLVRGYGTPAPGPAEPAQWVPPDAATLLAVPSWDWHRFGVDGQRYRTIRAAATVAARLEETVSMSEPGTVAGFTSAAQRLRVVPGIGEWTAAEISLRALGDPDAVSVGDFHLKNRVGYVLTGQARTTDEQMVELLEPWRGQRARIVRLVELSGVLPPKYGPRFAPTDMRSF